MKKTIYIFLAFGILLLVSIVIAIPTIEEVNKIIEVEAEEERLLNAFAVERGYEKFPTYHLDEIKCNEYECNTIWMDIPGIKHSPFTTNPKWSNGTLKPNSALEEEKEAWEDRMLENIMERQRINEEKASAGEMTAKVAGGDRTITEEK